MRVFLAVVRRGTLTEASGDLGINASTVHRRLAQLEGVMGTRLFDRAATGLTPTAAGEAMVPLAESVEDEVMRLWRGVAGQDSSPRGTVRLTAPESLLDLLVEPLAAFRVRYPDIDLLVEFSDRFVDLARREADVAVRPVPKPPETAVGRRVGTVAWTVYAAQEFATDGELPWVRYALDLTRLPAARWQATQDEERLAMAVNSVPAMHRVVACSPCKGLLPCFIGDADPLLTRLRDVVPEAESHLWLLAHPDLRKTTRVRALLDALWGALVTHRPLFEGECPQP
ncbi:MAG: LysR family transcriptional regulator [Myxococcota bacterium]